MCIWSLICIHPSPLSAGESRGTLWELSVNKNTFWKGFSLCPSLNVSNWEVWAEENSTPAEWKSRKIQLNLLRKRNSCYSGRISVLLSVPLEFSVRQSVSNNQVKTLKKKVPCCCHMYHIVHSNLKLGDLRSWRKREEEKLLTLMRMLMHLPSIMFPAGGMLGQCIYGYSITMSLLETPVPSIAREPSALRSLTTVLPDGHGGILQCWTQQGGTLPSREKDPLKNCMKFNGNTKSGVLLYSWQVFFSMNVRAGEIFLNEIDVLSGKMF